MKISILFYVKIATFLLLQPSMVDAKLLMSVILNNGILPTTEGFTCDAKDTQLIQNTIGTADDDDRRRLKTDRKCKDECKGQAAGSCHVTQCKGYRRRRILRGDRELDDEAYCASGILALNKTLNALLPQLSEGCRSVVHNKRKISCFDDVLFAAVDSFNMWNADSDTLIHANIKNNTAFCYTSSKLNIEAVANACVEEMDISIKGPVSKSREIESLGPYSVFGNTGTNFTGRILPVGTYTVKTTLEDSLTPTSSVTFTVKTCPPKN